MKEWKDMTEEEINQIKLDKCTSCAYSRNIYKNISKAKAGPIGMTCDYILIEGHSRKCRPEVCDKYKETKNENTRKLFKKC